MRYVLFCFNRIALAVAALTLTGCAWRGDGFIRSKRFVSAPPQEQLVVLSAKRAQTAPTLDGELTEECWKNAQRVHPSKPLQFMPNPIDEESLAMVCFDSDYLYFAFNYEDSAPAQIRAAFEGRDSKVWRDDSVEIFIDANLDRKTAYQFAVNSLGAIADMAVSAEWKQDPAAAVAGEMIRETTSDMKWDSGARAAGAVGKDGWTLEVAIPAKDLGIAPLTPGRRMGVNLCRNYPRKGAYLSWAPVDRFFLEPENFGTLVLGAGDLKAESVSFGAVGHGNNEASVTIINESNRPRRVETSLVINQPGAPKVTERNSRTIRPGKSATATLPYRLDFRLGEASLALSCRERDAKEDFYRREQTQEMAEPIRVKWEPPIVYADQSAAEVTLLLNIGNRTLREGRLEVSLADLSGTVIRTASLAKIDSPKAVLTVNVKGLAPGFYQLKCEAFDAAGTPVASSVQKMGVVSSVSP